VVEQKERQYAVADTATEQSYGPTDIMSAEVRDCWQNPKGCREPTNCIRGNTRKPSDSQRHDESHQSEENNALDESHAAICCIMRQGWALGSMSVEIRWGEKVESPITPNYDPGASPRKLPAGL